VRSLLRAEAEEGVVAFEGDEIGSTAVVDGPRHTPLALHGRVQRIDLKALVEPEQIVLGGRSHVLRGPRHKRAEKLQHQFARRKITQRVQSIPAVGDGGRAHLQLWRLAVAHAVNEGLLQALSERFGAAADLEPLVANPAPAPAPAPAPVSTLCCCQQGHNVQALTVPRDARVQGERAVVAALKHAGPYRRRGQRGEQAPASSDLGNLLASSAKGGPTAL